MTDPGAARSPEGAGAPGDIGQEEDVHPARAGQAAGASGGGDEGGDPVADGVPGDALDELKWEFDQLNDRHLRLAAEFNNYRRRTEQERADVRSRAQAELLGRVLDVLDDLERVAALDLESATVEAIMEGIDLVERKFLHALQEAAVDVIDPAEEAFDPERMEAILRVPTDDDALDDRVAQVFQKGYVLRGVLVRPARVSVFKQG